MPTPVIIQQKVFATKKRLSEPVITEQSLWCLGICCLLVVLLVGGQLIARGSKLGFIAIDIPVASQPLSDETLNGFKEQPTQSLSSHSIVLALTPSELIFGDVSSFTSHKSDVRNKFSIRHANGSPQVAEAISQIETWIEDRKRRLGIRPEGILILMPDPAVPVAIVSVVADKIRQSKTFAHIVLGGGML